MTNSLVPAVAEIATTASDGKTYQVEHFNLYAILSARKAIDEFKHSLLQRAEATDLFALERGEALQGILGSIEQTMFGSRLYRSREERPRTYCTSWSRTIHSRTGTSASVYEAILGLMSPAVKKQ